MPQKSSNSRAKKAGSARKSPRSSARGSGLKALDKKPLPAWVKESREQAQESLRRVQAEKAEFLFPLAWNGERGA